ncbi:hypothetical protein QVD17_09320 [Tagetes erecta]|uniref:Uncharacterized protein n=1 Tax=Tagetes erecta TaxID=13708 RepID=A0AAD8P4Y9_TARER|nr:hypothetical protein QVD17_09320 [Tagetes erecta]
MCVSYVLVVMSTDELSIFKELEKDVERDLEEEIKDGIYHLALRLHRLYQHQKERASEINEPAVSEPHTKQHEHAKNKILSELNINIRMENGTKIEIKETKNGITQVSPRHRPRSSTSLNVKRVATPSKKKFNWESTLRSEPLINVSHKSTKQKSLAKDVKRETKNNLVLAQRMENIPTKKITKKLISSGEKNVWAP